MKVAVSLPEGFAARIPLDRVNELLRPYCEGLGRPLPDGDPGPGMEIITVELQPALVAALKNNRIPADEAIRRVLAANANPEPKRASPRLVAPRANPAPQTTNPRSTPAWLAVLFAVLAPVVLIVAVFVFLRRIPAARGGGGFDEWSGGE